MKKILTLVFGLALGLSQTEIQAQTEVRFFTNYGTFDVMIHNDIMPITGGNFLELVDNEFYNGVIFHRVIEDFIIQGGDPTGTGTGGPGYAIDDEFHDSLSNVEKTISMANSGPNTGGSQFFFNMIDNTFLDPDEAPLTSKHPVFGTVTENWDVVQNISEVAVDATNRPVMEVVMDSIRRVDLLSVNESEINKNALSVYPNPITSTSVVEVYSTSGGASQLGIYNCMGSLVSSYSVTLEKGENSIALKNLAIDAMADGIYFLQLEGENNIIKLMID